MVASYTHKTEDDRVGNEFFFSVTRAVMEVHIGNCIYSLLNTPAGTASNKTISGFQYAKKHTESGAYLLSYQPKNSSIFTFCNSVSKFVGFISPLKITGLWRKSICNRGFVNPFAHMTAHSQNVIVSWCITFTTHLIHLFFTHMKISLRYF